MKPRIACLLIMMAALNACSNEGRSQEKTKQLITARHLNVLDEWVQRGGAKSRRQELAISCGILVQSLATDTASTLGDQMTERLYFCQDITVARVNVSTDEFRRLKRICGEHDDAFYQTLCQHGRFK